MSHVVDKEGELFKSGLHNNVLFFSKFDDDSFLLDLLSSTISDVYNFSETDSALQLWHEAFVKIYDKHAPFKTIWVRHTAIPKWLTKPIQDVIHYRDHLLKNRQHDNIKSKVTKLHPSFVHQKRIS